MGRALAIAIAIGLAWYVGEVVLGAVLGRAFDLDIVFEDFTRLLPWQISLFAAIGLAVSAVARWRALDGAAVGWLVVGGASFVFFAARIGEGLLRRHSLALALLGVALTAITLALGFGLLARAGRALPPRLRSRWPLAVWVGWSCYFLLSMQRAGPALGLMDTTFAWVPLLSPSDAVLGAVAALAVTLSALARWPSAAAVCALAVLGVGTWWTLQLGRPGAAGDAGGAVGRPDVVVLLVDTWRHDYLGASTGDPALTPEVDAVARESVLFTRAFSPGNYTKMAMPGIVASIPPTVGGSVLPSEVRTLAELLGDAGWSTVGISTNPYVSRASGYDQGFDRFLDPNQTNEFLVEHMLEILGATFPGPAYGAGILASSHYYRPAAQVRRAALGLLDGARRPAFLYVHTMDPHGPYLPPKEYLSPDFRLADFYSYYPFLRLSQQGVLDSEAFRPRLANLLDRYRAEVRFTDVELGRLVADLRRRGRWDESLVWLLSDHGESFGESDWAGHSGENMTSSVLRVPSLVKLPKSWGVAPRLEDTPISTYDVLPTILSLLGIDPPPGVFGRDLSALIRGGVPDADRVLVSFGGSMRGRRRQFYSLVRWPWKLDTRVDGEQVALRGLFHLERDAREQEDLRELHPEVVEQLIGELRAWRAREAESFLGADPGAQVDAATEERLRQLGYVE
ncbi:MAG: sulfatase [Myxococcota bacterium]|nr:sulfatase [Myxococcota bacterium]